MIHSKISMENHAVSTYLVRIRLLFPSEFLNSEKNNCQNFLHQLAYKGKDYGSHLNLLDQYSTL